MAFHNFSLQLAATRPLFSVSSFRPFPKPIQHEFSPYPTTTTPSNPLPMSPQMPLELVLSFIEAACTEVDNTDLLRACSLVCKAWSTSAQRLLFSHVSLRDQRSFELFMNAVDRSSPHGVVLGDAVKRLSVVLDHNQPCSLHHHSFALAINACPNLSALNISLYGCAEPGQDIVGIPDMSRLRRTAPSFDEQTLSLLKAGPMIEYLHFDNWSENQQSIFQLLDIWPSLQFLSIGGTSPQYVQDSPPPFSCSLRGLHLNFQTTPSIDFLKWLLHNSTDSLRILHFQRDPCFDAFEYLLNTHGSNLQSISFPAFGSAQYSNLIVKCSSLLELRTENPACPPAFYKNLPKQIQHLAFGIDRDSPLNTVIDVVKANDSLKAVSVQFWEGGSTHTLLASLQIASIYRGVELNTTNNLQDFRSMNIIKSIP